MRIKHIDKLIFTFVKHRKSLEKLESEIRVFHMHVNIQTHRKGFFTHHVHAYCRNVLSTYKHLKKNLRRRIQNTSVHVISSMTLLEGSSNTGFGQKRQSITNVFVCVSWKVTWYSEGQGTVFWVLLKISQNSDYSL